MKTIKIRILSLMLCFAIVFSILPQFHYQVFAKEIGATETDEALWEEYWEQYWEKHPEEWEALESNSQDKQTVTHSTATSLSAMQARAEALVNYTWTPSSNISTWNGAYYNGKTYFPSGSTVKGMPYTLFTSEISGIWSLCSLEQYKAVAAKNYSASAYCVSVSANRTGPVYGSCCADLVCEVFGGNFMNGSSPRYHSVSAIWNTSYGTTQHSQKMSDIRAGDALSDYPNHNHIVWVGEVTDTTITIYEQTPPAARTLTLSKSSYTNSSGYFVYGGLTYSTITRSKELTVEPPKAPQNVRTEKSLYSSNESITVYWDASIGATDYWVYMWKDGIQLYATDMGTNLSFTSAPTSAGQYTVIVRAGNSAGYSDDPASVSFIVYDTVPIPPTNLQTVAGRHEFYCDESIKFIWDPSEITTNYWVYMWKDGVELYATDMGNSLEFTSAPTSVGQYTFIVRAGNMLGYSKDGASINFTVQHDLRFSVTTNPTTSTAGTLTSTCSHCGVTTTITLPKLDTTNYNYQVVTVASCTADGVGRYTWKTTTYGTFSFDVAIPKTDHSYSYRATKEPTTSANGVLTGTCSKCSSTTTVTLPNLDTTNYNYQVVTAASCTADGNGRYAWKTTTYGTFSFDVAIPKTGHSYSYRATQAPTTSANGILTGTCSKCSGTTTVTLPKLDTTNYNYQVVTAATCTVGGTGRYTWKNTTYGTFYFDTAIGKTAHSYHKAVTEPTCTKDGYTTFTCSVCGSSYVENGGSALGHTWDSGTVTVEPAQGALGVRTYTCTRCGGTKTEIIPPLEHVHSYSTIVIQPTCTAQGYTIYTCTCGDSYDGSYVNALGHSWDSGVITKAPTVSNTGVRIYTCTRCSQTRTETIPMLGFVDVPEDRYYYNAVYWAAKNRITAGVDDTHFAPNNDCTRAQAVMFLWNAAGKPEVGGNVTNPFVDVGEGRYYYKAVLWAISEGITNGTDETHFSPNEELNRSTFVTFLWRAMGAKEVPVTDKFTDVSFSKFYARAVAWAVAEGITDGVSETTFGPSNLCTRAQVVTFLQRAYDK